MEKLLPILAALISAHGVRSHRGLLCTNDFLRSVSCLWNGSALDPSADCWISGVKKVFVDFEPEMITQSCLLKHHENSLPGCSFAFQNQEFSGSEVMPNISMRCDGTLVETIQSYKLRNHIKMHPPGAPHVNSTANATWISWSLGPDVSKYLIRSGVGFQVQLKKKGQTWEEASPLYTEQLEPVILVEKLEGRVELRVRARPLRRTPSQWSEWSPTASWTGASDQPEAPGSEEWWLRQTAVLSVGLLLPLCLIISALLIIYRSYKTRGLLKKKPIPNPSEYFCTLHSVHGGNLKSWLNPLSDSGSFFTSQPCEQISPVVLCESWDGVPSAPPAASSSTSALLHFQNRRSDGSQTSGAVDDSSSSSCFSNIGYFMSSSSGGSDHANSNLAYFTYQDDPCALQPFLFPSLAPWTTYESLKKEPHSPDSGFCIGKEDELDIDLDVEDDLDDLSSHLLTLPLQLPFQICPLTSPPGPPHPVSVAPVSPDVQPADVVATVASSGGSGSPGAMCRSSSMPAESCRTGYVTLKELQTTFSNKSI
ncbi:interleukin-2 receptor subunit beta-like isoform X2 [Salarias fasciatus]|nr:interleukin-2 receptor subunit beta-like isoform X2 [Salarias fasciatus]